MAIAESNIQKVANVADVDGMEPTVMKVICGEQLHRILLPPQPDFDSVEAAVQRLSPGPGIATFIGTKGAPRVLSEATFDELLATAYVGPTGRPTLRLELQPPLVVGLQPAATVSSAVVHGQADTHRSGDAGRSRKHASRKGERRSGKLSNASTEMWQKDNRDIDDLIRGLGDDLQVSPVAPRTEKAAKKRGRRKKVGGSGKSSAREESCEECQQSTEVEPQVAPPVAPSTLVTTASDPQQPVTLWDATPESTPPSSPRHCPSQFQAFGPPQAVFWVPVPVWMTQ